MSTLENLHVIIKQRNGKPMLDIDAQIPINKTNGDILYTALVPDGMNVVLQFVSLVVTSGTSGSFRLEWVAGGASSSGRVLIPDTISSTHLSCNVSCPPGTKLLLKNGVEENGDRIVDVIASGEAFSL